MNKRRIVTIPVLCLVSAALAASSCGGQLRRELGGGATTSDRAGSAGASADGAVVTMNPYVAAAKFVIGKNATARDINAIGTEIAKQIGDYVRQRQLAAR